MENLQFPLDCQFRVIAENQNGMHFVIETVLIQLGIKSELHRENLSVGKKYQSFSFLVKVESLERMNQIDGALRNIAGVKMVF